MKPVDSSGSKGVSRIDCAEQAGELLEYAMSYSRGHRIIVEEFVEKYGYQIAGDGLSVDGKLVFRYFANDHFDERCKNPFVPVAASFPYNMPDDVQNAYFPVVFDGYKYTRNEIFEMLSEQGITARKYFYPLTNSFECYRNYPTAGTEKTSVAQHLALRVLTLPLYADLALEDVDRICDVILGQKA